MSKQQAIQQIEVINNMPPEERRAEIDRLTSEMLTARGAGAADTILQNFSILWNVTKSTGDGDQMDDPTPGH